MTTALSTHPRIFSDRYLDKKMGHFSLLHLPEFEKKLGLLKEWQAGIASQRTLKAKEEQLQDDFLKLFFGEVLDYSYRQDLSTWQLEREYKTVLDGTKADGALGYFSLEKDKLTGLCRAVIELKDARSDLDKPQSRQNDRRTPVQQAFDYASAVGGDCRWVIVSNFLEIRLYHQSDRSRYERFEISQLNDEATLKRFFFLLQQSRLLSQSESPLDQLYCDTTVYMLGSDSYFLLGILNSKLFTFLFSKVSSEIRGGFLRWKKQYMKDMPIPTATPDQEAELAALAEQNQALHQKRTETRAKALAFLGNELGLGKVSQKLEKFETLSWSDFAAELGKQKIKLNLSQKEEWQDWHAGKVQALADLRGQIAALDVAIDRQVYGLYGLSAAEIALVEDNLQQQS